MKLTKAQTKEALDLLKWAAEDDKFGDEIGEFLERIEKRPEKRSTTHKERVFYIGTTTFFFRFLQENEVVMPGWYWAKATLDSRDHFSRDRGRTAARRRFFKNYLDRSVLFFGCDDPKFDDVEKLLNV